MKKNFSKALAGTLTVAMVLGMAAPAAGTTAQAYAKNGIKTKYSAIYAGKTKTYTLKTAKKNTKWSVTGEGKQYVTLSAKKGKSVKATIAKDAPAGIKATVVAKLKKGKKYKKVDADKFTIKVDATAVAVEGNGEVKTGSTATYTAKTTPAKTTNHVYFTVTDKNGNATTGATMNATSGVLTANAAGEYKVNVATARGDKKAAEGKFTANASMDVKVTDPAIPDAKLTSAKQTEAKKIVVTFDSEVKELKKEDITIVSDSTDKTSKTLKSVEIGADKKSATIEVLVDILDGKSYTVTYKGSTAQFTASDNVVADFSINTTEFQVKKPMEMKINVLDKNQVIIKVLDVKNTSVIDGNFSVNVTSNDGYFKDDKLVMQTVGKTEEVTASYFNGKYNGTTGEKEGLIEKKFTITAVAAENLASKYEYATISDYAPDDWSETKCNLQLPINEPTFKNLYAKILDVKGVKTIDGVVNNTELNISCSSSDDTILLVESSDDNVVLTGVKAGTAYVQVRQNSKTMLTIPVTVTATRALTNAVLDGANATISNSTRINDDKEVKLDTHKDQYGREFTKYELDSVELKSWPTQKDTTGRIPGKLWGEAQKDVKIYGDDGRAKGFKFQAYVTPSALVDGYIEQAPVGTYKYEVTFKDIDTDKKVMRVQTITVKKPDFTKAPTVKIDMDSDCDVAMKKAGDVKPDSKEAKLALFYDGVKGAYVDMPTYKWITLTKNGSTEKGKVTNASIIAAVEDAIVTSAAINKVGTSGGALSVRVIKFATKVEKNEDGVTFVDKLGTGNYAFKVDLKTSGETSNINNVAGDYARLAGKSLTKGVTDSTKTDLTKTITIKDTQPKLVVNQVKNNVDAASAHEAIEKTCTFKYDGKTRYKADDIDSYIGMQFACDKTKQDNTKDNQYYLNGKVYNIVKLNAYLYMPNDDEKVLPEDNHDRYVKFELKPGFSITVND